LYTIVLGIYTEIFYEDDIIMTSRVHRTQSISAVFGPFFHYLPSVKHHCELRLPEI